VAISYPSRGHLYTTPLFFAAVFISCWYGGIGPAILTTIASTAAIHFLLRLPGRGFTPDVHDLPRLAEFVFMAAVAIYLVQARKRSEQSVRQARDQLEIKVNERTADLQREVAERRRAEQAAQTAAQMAQSHVDMLLHSVDVLATEAAPRRSLGRCFGPLAITSMHSKSGYGCALRRTIRCTCASLSQGSNRSG